MTAPRAKDPLNGVTLEAMLSALVAHFGWSELGERVAINSFKSDPSIASSLKFLRKTQWAREKVESLYLFMLREQTRQERNAPVAAPFGSWASPVTADSIVGDSIRLGQIGVLGSDIFWTEGRPQEQGRNVLVWRSGDGRMRDMTPAPLNVRSRVHEYGGGAFTLGRKAGFFVNDADQQVWRLRAGEAPHALTALPGKRHADLEIDAHHKRLICVREDHGDSGEAVTTLVAISLANGTEQVLVSGHDFFSNPRLSPDGRSLAWLGWDHPNMPWDGTTLWLATVAADGKLGPARSVAGGVNESIFQPSWSPRGKLHFVSDRSGWWNLYRVRAADDSLQALHPMEAEFGQAQWAFAMSRYGFDARGRIVCSVTQDGRSMLALLDADAGTFEPIQTPFCSIHELQVGDGFAVFLGSTETAAEAVIRFDLARGTFDVLRSTTRGTLDESLVSKAEAFSFPTEHGLTAHAFFYPPVNPRFHGPQGELPPLIVVGHGGPTGATNAAFRLGYQYWTSRGFAIVDVNYGGSIGYGRAYRERLNGAWGVVDVADAINAARFLIERGDVDAERVVIRGSSAGGYTTLSALTFHRFFKAGASHYGIGDLEALVRDTHKFESRYLDSLIGPYPSPLYGERSPIHHTDQLASPMILFQGAEDKAVPPAQAEAMFEAVRAKGLPVAYLLFEGEQHGFRRAATIKRALEAELFFYGRVLGFTPADRIEPVVIENLTASASASASASAAADDRT